MSACPTLETERLILRPFDEDDLDPYTVLLQTPEVRRALHLADDVGREEAWRQLALWRGQWELRGTGQWALVDKSSARLVGRAGLHRPEARDWPGVEVGWVLHPDHWGQGYATEAGRRSVDYAFGTLGLQEVYSVILPENERSRAVAARLGFAVIEKRVLSTFPSMPHEIWCLARP